MLTITEIEKEDRKPQGLRNGGKVHLECSACGKELVECWITNPDAKDPATGKPFHWKVQAGCCYCGDHSFVKEFDGRYHLAGAGINNPEDEDDAKVLTVVTNIEIRGDVYFFTTKKAN